MQTPRGVIESHKSYCLEYLEQLKFKENGFNEEDVRADMKAVMRLLDILEDTSQSDIDILREFRIEKGKNDWNFGFNI